MIDPIKLARVTEKIVCRDLNKKYYRFRSAPFYGGIATADCVGCCLRCAFCWSWNIVKNPEGVGKFYSPKEVADRLINIAEGKGYDKIRISGGEPTIGKDHLLDVLDLIPEKYLFILETNGILINEEYARELSKYKNLHIRVSIKSDNQETFERITSISADNLERQFKALDNLFRFNVSCHPSIVIDYCKNIDEIKERLEKINPKFSDELEGEKLILYPAVRKRLERLKI